MNSSFRFKREKNVYGDIYVVTPPTMQEAGRYFERQVFGNELAVFVKAESKLQWNEKSDISG